MKKFLSVCLILVAINSQAQWGLSGNAGTSPGTNFVGTTDNAGLLFKTYGTSKMQIDVDGNIQVWGNNPYMRFSDRFHIQQMYTSANNYVRGIFSNNITWNNQNNLWRVGSGPYDDFAMIRFDNNGRMGFYTREITGSSYDISESSLYAYQRMHIDNNGNVGIATDDTKGYKFAVNGSAIFTSVKVKLQASWPDYVFNHDYKLPTLPEVEQYIQQNKHLPGVPSATEVAKEGLDVEKTQATLLKKVEEMTLYIIQLNKEVEAMKAEMQSLKSKKNN